MNSLTRIFDDIPSTPRSCGDFLDIHGLTFVSGGAIHGEFFGTTNLVNVRSDTGAAWLKNDSCAYSIGGPHDV